MNSLKSVSDCFYYHHTCKGVIRYSTFAGRKILITGAAGSIGSEMTRQVAACRPAEMVLMKTVLNVLCRKDVEVAPKGCLLSVERRNRYASEENK